MKVFNALVGGLLILSAFGCNSDMTDRTGRIERDNTAVNERDADGDTVTPFEQSNDSADIELVAKIRREVVAVKDMSINGQNVKIITNNGKVIMRGPVATAAEKDTIERIAVAAAGEGKVTNNLEIDRD